MARLRADKCRGDAGEAAADLADRLCVVRVDRHAGEAKHQLTRQRRIVVLAGVLPPRLEGEVDAAVDLNVEDRSVTAAELRIEIAAATVAVEARLQLGLREAVSATEGKERDLGQGLRTPFEVDEQPLQRFPVTHFARGFELVHE